MIILEILIGLFVWLGLILYGLGCKDGKFYR